MWYHDDMQGCFNDLTPPNSDSDYSNGSPTWNNCVGHMGDQISSYINRSSHWITWYQHEDYAGQLFCAAPGASSKNLADFGGSPENTFSSHITSTTRPINCTWTDVD